MGPGGVPPSLWATRVVAGAGGMTWKVEGDKEGAVWVCESPATLEGRGQWSALEFVQ